jgi:hypothetical protein
MLSHDDQYLVIAAPLPVTLTLPVLEKTVPKEFHGTMQRGKSITVTSVREGVISSVKASQGNHINISYTSTSVSQGESITFVSYGKNWFTV